MSNLSPPQLDQWVRAGAESLRKGDAAGARETFELALSARPMDVSALIGLAFACRDLGDDRAQMATLDRVLELQPRHLAALLMKADHFSKIADFRAAQAFYRAVVDYSPTSASLPPDVRAEVQRAKREADRLTRSSTSHLSDALSNAGYSRGRSSRRFTHAIDLLFGDKKIYFQSPTAFYFPELPQRQFYEREEFSWLPMLESKTALIRDELLRVLEDGDAFRPYIQSDGSRPPRDFGALLDNRNWGAFYLIKSGQRTEGAERCPKTLDALVSAPLTAAPGQTPSVLFSLLRPGTRIPPHCGHTNARLICHLPLIVPEDCGLRVGNERREWVEGEALVFDDSIEHEAWNNSDRTRVVLLFDIWRPELTEGERRLVGATLAAVKSFDSAATRSA